MFSSFDKIKEYKDCTALNQSVKTLFVEIIFTLKDQL